MMFLIFQTGLVTLKTVSDFKHVNIQHRAVHQRSRALPTGINLHLHRLTLEFVDAHSHPYAYGNLSLGSMSYHLFNNNNNFYYYY